MKLPSLGVTQRTTRRKVTNRTIRRSYSIAISEEQRKENVDDEFSDGDGPDWVDFHSSEPDISGVSEPSLHSIARKASSASWQQVRGSMLNACIEIHALPPGQLCIVCQKQALCRCIQCAPWAFYCCNCWKESHKKVNIFHKGEIWEVSMYYKCIGA